MNNLLELNIQFLCHDSAKFAAELKALIDKHTSDSDYGTDVIVIVKEYS